MNYWDDDLKRTRYYLRESNKIRREQAMRLEEAMKQIKELEAQAKEGKKTCDCEEAEDANDS